MGWEVSIRLRPIWKLTLHFEIWIAFLKDGNDDVDDDPVANVAISKKSKRHQNDATTFYSATFRGLFILSSLYRCQCDQVVEFFCSILGHLQQMKIDHEQKFCQDRINFLQMLNKPYNFGSKECKYVPKWRNIAKSGHTDRCTYGFIFKHCVSQNGSSPPSTKVLRRKKHNNSSYN